MTQDSLENWISCPECDLVHRVDGRVAGQWLTCARCHSVLIAPRRNAGLKIILLAFASVILVIGAVTQPFLTLRRIGLTSDATLVEVATSFTGPLLALSLLLICAVVVLPLTRLLITLYVLVPLVANRPPLPGAASAFRLSERLRPWSMAEIFALGAGVALIKIVDLAHVSLGPAFWMFAGLVVLLIVQDTLMCRWSVWRALER